MTKSWERWMGWEFYYKNFGLIVVRLLVRSLYISQCELLENLCGLWYTSSLLCLWLCCIYVRSPHRRRRPFSIHLHLPLRRHQIVKFIYTCTSCPLDVRTFSCKGLSPLLKWDLCIVFLFQKIVTKNPWGWKEERTHYTIKRRTTRSVSTVSGLYRVTWTENRKVTDINSGLRVTDCLGSNNYSFYYSDLRFRVPCILSLKNSHDEWRPLSSSIYLLLFYDYKSHYTTRSFQKDSL